MPIIAEETVRNVAGVKGRAFTVIADDTGRILNQTWKSSRVRGTKTLTVEMRFDDECNNGHETFAITATLTDSSVRRDRGIVAGGCLHDDIAKWFPELRSLIRWHLVSTDGPLHYIANTVYLAGDRDAWGLRSGESRQIRNGKTGLPCWRLEHAAGSKYKAGAYYDGETPPDDVPTLEWVPLMQVGEGKPRELDAARSCAVWPEATDEELCADPETLRVALDARLPGLLAQFRHDMTEICGFVWPEGR